MTRFSLPTVDPRSAVLARVKGDLGIARGVWRIIGNQVNAGASELDVTATRYREFELAVARLRRLDSELHHLPPRMADEVRDITGCSAQLIAQQRKAR